MKKLFLCSLVLGAASAASAARQSHRRGLDGHDHRLRDGQRQRLFRPHPHAEDGGDGRHQTGAMLGAGGMEPSPNEVINWLSKDSIKKMRGHVGHKVEVMGKITDVSTGTVQVKQEPGKDGRDNKVEVDARGKDGPERRIARSRGSPRRAWGRRRTRSGRCPSTASMWIPSA